MFTSQNNRFILAICLTLLIHISLFIFLVAVPLKESSSKKQQPFSITITATSQKMKNKKTPHLIKSSSLQSQRAKNIKKTKALSSSPMPPSSSITNSIEVSKKDNSESLRKNRQKSPSISQFYPLLAAAVNQADKYYPKNQFSKGKEASITIKITINRKGGIESIDSVGTSAQEKEFSEAAIQLFKDLFKTNYPQGYPHNYLRAVTLKIPIQFKLKKKS